jgi:hypothetical protein
MKVALSLIVALFTAQALAATNQSAKKLELQNNKLRPPQVLEVGDSTLGIRGARGNAFEGSNVMGVSYEYMMRPNVGLNLQLHYASYDTTYAVGPISGKFTYTVTIPVVAANFHFDAFQVKRLDTYATIGIAHSFVESKWEQDSNAFNFPAPKGTAKSDSTFFIGYLNARYFIDRNWSFNVAAGSGLGNFGLGMDYLF